MRIRSWRNICFVNGKPCSAQHVAAKSARYPGAYQRCRTACSLPAISNLHCSRVFAVNNKVPRSSKIDTKAQIFLSPQLWNVSSIVSIVAQANEEINRLPADRTAASLILSERPSSGIISKPIINDRSIPSFASSFDTSVLSPAAHNRQTAGDT